MKKMLRFLVVFLLIGLFLILGGMLALILILVMALPREGYLRPQWATDARNSLLRSVSDRMERFFDMETLNSVLLTELGLDLSIPEESGGTGTGALNTAGAFGGGQSRVENLLSVGPRRCLVECYGHDINLTQRELRYTAIPDLREEYHPGEELECVVTGFDPEKDDLQISVKATQSNPFDGAEQRHPVGSRRYATIAGKYGGGVFCNLPDGTVCMCNYSYQHEDSDFMVGDTVIVLVQRFAEEKRQMYGKIMSKW